MAKAKQSLPLWLWRVILGFVALAGVYLIWANPCMPPHMARLSDRVRPEAWMLFLGIVLVSLPVAHVLISLALFCMRELFELDDEKDEAEKDNARKNLWPPALVGACESVMYPMALFFGKPEFIGVWLAIKVAGGWTRWNPASASDGDRKQINTGRRKYSAFLVGNALSITLACITWAALKVWTSPDRCIN